MPTTSKVKAIPLRLSEDDARLLRERAGKAGLSMNAYARRALVGLNGGAEATCAPSIEGADDTPLMAPPVPFPPAFRKTFRWAWEDGPDALVNAGRHVLLRGIQGGGKTQWALGTAQRLGRPFYTFTCHAGVTSETVEGGYMPFVSGGQVIVRAVDGLLTSAIRQAAIPPGAVLNVEEITRMDGDLQGRFLSALDPKRGVFDVVYRRGAVPVPDGFLCLATGNPVGQEFKGVGDIDNALLRRFAVFDVPDPTEAELTTFAKTLALPKDVRDPLVKTAATSYEKYRSGETDNVVSPGDMAMFADSLAGGAPERTAFFAVIANKFCNRETPDDARKYREGMWEDYTGRKPVVVPVPEGGAA